MCCCCCHIPISVWAKRVFEDMYKAEHEREVCVLKTELQEVESKLQEVESKNRLLHNSVQARYKEMRRLGDTIRSQQLEIYALYKQDQRLQKENQNFRRTLEDILPNFCRVSYSEREDGAVLLDLGHLD